MDEFIENLGAEPSVFQNVVRCSRIYRPVDAESLRDALKAEVVYQASAVIDLGDDGQYLLEVGINCGMDYHDGEKDLGGTEAAGKLSEALLDYCESRGLAVRPGVIDM